MEYFSNFIHIFDSVCVMLILAMLIIVSFSKD